MFHASTRPRVSSTTAPLWFLLSLLAVPSVAKGQNLIVNGSFESPPLPSGYQLLPGGDSTSIQGWQTISPGVERFTIARALPTSGGSAQDGSLLVDLNTDGLVGGGGIQQSVATIVGASYTLTFYAGTLKVGGFTGVATITASAGEVTKFITLTNFTNVVQWTQFSLTFTAASQNTLISFKTSDPSGSGFSFLDDVRLTSACQVNACGDTSNPSAIGCVRVFVFDVAYERAEFIPRADLDTAARECGFKSFNWQQMITTLPCGSQIRPAVPSKIAQVNLCQDGSLTASPTTPFFDPPPGSYTYQLNDPYPFAYPSSFVLPNSGQCSLPGYCPPFPEIATNNTLSFVDAPNNPALPGVPASPNPPPGTFMAFSTALVGVIVDNSGQETPSSPLFSWTWNSTYNGRTVASGVSQTASVYPLVAGSGTGGVTITAINDAPQVPPSVSCTASPNTLWPPNGKSIVVTLTGAITPGTQSIPPSGITYSVADEYSQVQPSGHVALDASGRYALGVSLIASRHGNDQDGRAYTIVVGARDAVGNRGTCSVLIRVPHDQGV